VNIVTGITAAGLKSKKRVEIPEKSGLYAAIALTNRATPKGGFFPLF
jgi:hypothetical protein